MKPITEEYAPLTTRADDRRGIGQFNRPPVSRKVALAAAAVVAVTTVAALTTSLLGRRIYGGRVDIVVSTAGYDSEAASVRRLTTEKLIVESERGLGPVARAEHTSFKRLRNATSVKVVDETDILRVTVGDANRARAVRLAQAVADSYLGKIAPAPSSPDPTTASVTASLAELRSRKAQMAAARTGGAESGPPSPEEQRLAAEESALAARLDALQAAGARSGAASPSAILVARARLLDHPLRPRPVQAAAGGVLAGLFLGAGVLVVSWAAARRPWDAWT